MEQSCELELELVVVEVRVLFAMVCRRLWAATLKWAMGHRLAIAQEAGGLGKDEDKERGAGWVASLKNVGLVLPAAVQLEAHLDAAEDHFLATLEVDAELDDVAVVDGVCLALLRGGTESNVVQKGSG